MRKDDGFQPMELDVEHDGDTSSGGRRRRRRPWVSLSERRPRSRRSSELSKYLLWGVVVACILLLIGAVLFSQDGEKTLVGAGFLPGNNRDECPPPSEDGATSHYGHNNNTTTTVALHPPMARRDVDRTVQFGIAPADWDPSLRRQSDDSELSLMDPPQLVPDPYGWMRDDDRSNSTILQHLEAENNFTQQRLQHLEPLRDILYEELKGYLEETSHSFPTLDRSFYYYRRTVEGQAYPLHCRAPKPANIDHSMTSGRYVHEHLAAWTGTADVPLLPQEEIFMDENTLSQDHDFFRVGALEISPSETLVAYTVDYAGNELYQLVIQRMDTGEIVHRGGEELILSESLAWGHDDETLFYGKVDEAQRTFQVYRRNWSFDDEELLYEELDVTFWVGFASTSDKRYLLIETASSESSEVYYVDLLAGTDYNESANSTTATSVSRISHRRANVLYSVEHAHGTWWIMTNVQDAKGDMELWTVPVGQEDDAKWSRVMSPSTSEPLLADADIEGLSIFAKHIAVQGREGGMPRVWVLDVDLPHTNNVTRCERLDFSDEAAHTVDLGWNPEYNTSTMIVNYVSLVTPSQQIQVDLSEPNLTDEVHRLVVHEAPVPGYQKSLYGCHRIDVLSRDGHTQIPVSLVYRQSTLTKVESQNRTVAIHLYAYGAYGASMDDSFSSTRLPLLDRGVIFAVAHVRGGGELGRNWYLDGKLFNKHKTFDDFVDVGRYFVHERRWTTPDLLSCEGRSAGGLTMGASLNQAPELFRAAILGVPFVDLIVTMMDASIPLTTGEWNEWGNPNEATYFDAMMAYSPMNNVQATSYPSILLLAGLFDPRVAYWEPAKLTATLRHKAIPNENRPVCLKTDMTSGHFSASDRYKHIKARAFEYAFVLDQIGIA